MIMPLEPFLPSFVITLPWIAGFNINVEISIVRKVWTSWVGRRWIAIPCPVELISCILSHPAQIVSRWCRLERTFPKGLLSRSCSSSGCSCRRRRSWRSRGSCRRWSSGRWYRIDSIDCINISYRSLNKATCHLRSVSKLIIWTSRAQHKILCCYKNIM